MKKVLLFMLMCVLSLHAYSQSKDYFYQHGGLLYHLSFYTDKENDYVADAFCLNMFYKFGYKGKDSRGQLRFQSFTYVAEQKNGSDLLFATPNSANDWSCDKKLYK